ncbi:uncharacterized protein [Halyomorpha halys]|uniref:uncharacterized protein n=1 Tax=Halyomorpha halys TaxID=286706 RepID=UPI0034D33205
MTDETNPPLTTIVIKEEDVERKINHDDHVLMKEELLIPDVVIKEEEGPEIDCGEQNINLVFHGLKTFPKTFLLHWIIFV